jgi:hypothetical protein
MEKLYKNIDKKQHKALGAGFVSPGKANHCLAAFPDDQAL